MWNLGLLGAAGAAGAQNYYFSYDGKGTAATTGNGYTFTEDNKLIGYSNDGPSGDVGYVIELDGTGTVLSRTDYRSNVGGGDNRSRIRDFGKYDGIEYAVITDESTGNSDPNILKFTSGGAIDWQRSIGLGTGGSNNVIPTFLTVDSSGNVYTAMIAYPQQLVITKHNSSGVLQWQKYLDDASLEASQPSVSLSTDSSGNIYVMGWFISSTYGSLMGAIKLNSSGAIQWQKYGEWTDDSPYTVGIADSSGNVYLTGRAQLGPTSFENWPMPLVKYNSSGVLQWTTYLNLGTSTGLVDRTTTPVIDSNGNIIVISSVSTLNGLHIASFDSSGTLNWQRQMTTGSPYRPTLIETSRATIDANDNVRIAYRYFDGTQGHIGGAVFPADGNFIGTYTNGTESWVVSASSATQTTDSNFTERTVSLSATNSSLTETSGRIEAFSSSDFTLKILEA